ncbi:hypothetical protein DPMN_137468 [Dreissena polymorpha]|uniref:Uncharacterized protein n=1 Tax=Dreissena polymorpha TaxID=45954 RepID=A0A9D4JEQ8_DREPO|nr:hypothetical protein DPMN_137468 [Dreissena polymorpha]
MSILGGGQRQRARHGNVMRMRQREYHAFDVVMNIKRQAEYVLPWKYNTIYWCTIVIVGSRLLECHQGPDHRKQANESKTELVATGDHNYRQMAYKKRVMCSKKLGCTAPILLRECIRFQDYKPKKDSHICQDKCSQQLRNDLQSSVYDEVRMEKCIFIDLPKIEDHQGHIMGDAANLKVPIDDTITSGTSSMRTSPNQERSRGM